MHPGGSLADKLPEFTGVFVVGEQLGFKPGLVLGGGENF